MSSAANGAIGTVASVDPLLGPPVLFDTGALGLGGSPILDFAANGGLMIGGLEVFGGGVFVTVDDGGLGADTTILQLVGAPGGIGFAGPVGAPAPIILNSRGYDLTAGPFGLLNVAGTLLVGPGPVPGIHGLDPTGAAAPATFAATAGEWTTSGLTFAPSPLGPVATVSTDGVPGGLIGAPNPGGIYSVPLGGPEAVIALDALPPPGGVASPGDDHVVTLDGRTIFLNDGSHDMHDVTGGAGAVGLLIDLDLVPPVAPSLSLGGVRGEVDPVSGNIFTGWGLGGPGAPPGGSDILRVDEFGAFAAVSLIGFDNVRDIDFGPCILACGPTGVSLFVTEVEFPAAAAPWSNIWEVAVLPEPASIGLMLLGLVFAGRRSRVNS